MDGKGFQVWLSAARGLTRAQRREALAVLSGRSEGEASKAAIELGVDEARRCPHCSSEGAVSRGMARGLRRYQCKGCGRTFNALSGTPLSGLHHKERWLSFGASLAKGETVKASAARCDVAVSTAFPLASPVSGGGAKRFGGAQGDRGSGRDLRPGEPEGRARAGTQGTAAGRQGEEARPFARAGAGSHGGGPERDDGQRCAAQGRCGGAHGCSRPGGREGRPAGLRRWRELPTLRRRARGEPRSAQPLDGGTGSGRSACADGEQPPQPVEDFLRPRRGIATRYPNLSWFHLVGLAPGANDRAFAPPP